MLLEIGNWQVRSWQQSDVAALVKYANNRNVSRNLRDAFPYPYTFDDAEAWIRLATSQQPETNFAIADAEEAIGGIGFRLGEDVFRRTAEIGFWLGESHWGRGIATRAVRALTNYAFAEHDLSRIEAHVYEWNPASARVLEKAGYVLEGRLRKSVTKNGITMDRFLYALVRD